MHLKLARLYVHGELGVVHRTHEADSGGYDEQHLVADAHPESLQAVVRTVVLQLKEGK